MAISRSNLDPELRYIHTRRSVRVSDGDANARAAQAGKTLMQCDAPARGVRWRVAGRCATALGACSSGGNIDLGNSQVGDPATVDFPIFYVKRQVPLDAAGALMQDDLRIMRDVVPSRRTCTCAPAPPRARRKPTSPRASPTGALWDVKDVDTSADGKKVVFAMRGPLAHEPGRQEAALLAHLRVRHRDR